MSQQCAQVAKNANGTWPGSGMVKPAGAEQCFFPCPKHWLGSVLSAVSILCPQFSKDMEGLEHFERRTTRLVRGLEHNSFEECLRELGMFILEMRRLMADKGVPGDRLDLMISKVFYSLDDSVIL